MKDIFAAEFPVSVELLTSPAERKLIEAECIRVAEGRCRQLGGIVGGVAHIGWTRDLDANPLFVEVLTVELLADRPDDGPAIPEPTPHERVRAELRRTLNAHEVAAVRRVVEAVTVEGPSPRYHRAQLDRLRREWPTLATALDDLIATVGGTR